jgi:hypothetical protein
LHSPSLVQKKKQGWDFCNYLIFKGGSQKIKAGAGGKNQRTKTKPGTSTIWQFAAAPEPPNSPCDLKREKKEEMEDGDKEEEEEETTEEEEKMMEDLIFKHWWQKRKSIAANVAKLDMKVTFVKTIIISQKHSLHKQTTEI